MTSRTGGTGLPLIDDLPRIEKSGFLTVYPGNSLFLLLPSTASAQGAITGVVKDASGGVLPGVTVEASSPVLIEKVRTVVTDDTGQYRIVDLLSGTYTVTFGLPGFSTIRREGIELSGSFVATVNAARRSARSRRRLR